MYASPLAKSAVFSEFILVSVEERVFNSDARKKQMAASSAKPGRR